MNVLINPTKEESGSGITAQATWQNPTVQAAFNRMFGMDTNCERITQIEITSEWITARLERVK